MKNLAHLFTNDKLSKRTTNNYSNGKLSTIIFEREKKENGIKYDFKVIYGNANSIYPDPNSIEIMNDSLNVKKTKTEEKKSFDNMLTKVPKGTFVCFSYRGFMGLIVDITKKVNETTALSNNNCTRMPQDLYFNKTSTVKDFAGIKIRKLSSSKMDKSIWVMDKTI